MTAVPSQITIERVRGDTYPFVLSIQDAAGAPIDVTGFSFLLTVDPSDEPADATNNLFQLVGAIIDAANGKVQFTPTTLDADHVGEFFHDVQQTDGTGAIRTIAKGPYNLSQDITK